MSKIKFEIISKGIVSLLKSNEMGDTLMIHADKIKGNLGAGYSAQKVMSSDRVKVFVKANSKKAQKDNLKNNSLLKALK